MPMPMHADVKSCASLNEDAETEVTLYELKFYIFQAISMVLEFYNDR